MVSRIHWPSRSHGQQKVSCVVPRSEEREDWSLGDECILTKLGQFQEKNSPFQSKYIPLLWKMMILWIMSGTICTNCNSARNLYVCLYCYMLTEIGGAELHWKTVTGKRGNLSIEMTKNWPMVYTVGKMKYNWWTDWNFIIKLIACNFSLFSFWPEEAYSQEQHVHTTSLSERCFTISWHGTEL
jgi:hypothetical protein